MPLPVNWTLVPIVWQVYNYPSGEPLDGWVRFESAQTVTAGSNTYVPEPLTAKVVDGVMEAVSLPSTDDPDITPSGGWYYKVTTHFHDGYGPKSFYVTVPRNTAGSLNLALVVPVALPDSATVVSVADGLLASLISGPSMVRNALDAAVVADLTDGPARARIIPEGRGVVLFGDSHMEAFSGTFAPGYDAIYEHGWWTWAQVFARQPFEVIANKGIGGNTTAMMLARLEADVLAFTPTAQYVALSAGLNDLLTGVSLATIQSNLTAIYDRLNRKGVVVIDTDLWATGALTSPQRDDLHRLNEWKHAYAARNRGVIFLSAAWTVTDISTGLIAPSRTTDGTHLNGEGAHVFGQEAARMLSTMFQSMAHLPVAIGSAAGGPGSPNEFSPNSVFAPPDASGLAQWWSVADSGPPTVTPSIVSRPAQPGGRWQQFVVTGAGSSDHARIETAVLSGFTPGVTRAWAECEFETDAAGWTADRLQIEVVAFNASNAQLGGTFGPMALSTNMNGERPASGVMVTPAWTIPVGTAYIKQALVLHGGNGTVRVARFPLWKVA